MEQAEQLVTTVMAEAPRLVGSYYDAMELVPDGVYGAGVMEPLVRAIRARLPAAAVRVDAELLVRLPTARWPASRSAEDAVEDVEAVEGAPWCEGATRDSCVRAALAKASAVERLAPAECEGHALLARIRIATGDAVKGVTELEEAAGMVTDRVSCLEQLVAVARGAGNERATAAALDKILSAGCGDAQECARNLLWVGRQYEATGQPHKALALYRRAFEQAPDDEVLAYLAGLAAGLGLHAEAASDYEQLARRHPENPQWHKTAVAEHDAAVRATVNL
jgi:tetratricopeptide (TPR) repeat protein